MVKIKTRRKKKTFAEKITSKPDRFWRIVSNMKHKDLVKSCVLKGCAFEDILNWGHPKLVEWLYENLDNGEDVNRLVEYDSWRDKMAEDKGYEKIHPLLKLGYSGDIEQLDKVKENKPNHVPKVSKKPRAEMDSQMGVRKGTKKHMTFDLTAQGKDIKSIIKEVIAQFPDAQEKSIKIWHKRALKAKKA